MKKYEKFNINHAYSLADTMTKGLEWNFWKRLRMEMARDNLNNLDIIMITTLTHRV